MDLDGIEVSGGLLISVQSGFGDSAHLANQILVECGLGQRRGGDTILDASAWYSVRDLLRALNLIHDRIGKRVLYQVGCQVPRNATRPPDMGTDVTTLIGSLDGGYHFNHRRSGMVMFDPLSGRMVEGIGHYAMEPLGRPNALKVVCDNPYPCDLDRGIIQGLALEGSKTALVVHEPAKPCRKEGGDRCTYSVTWS